MGYYVLSKTYTINIAEKRNVHERVCGDITTISIDFALIHFSIYWLNLNNHEPLNIQKVNYIITVKFEIFLQSTRMEDATSCISADTKSIFSSKQDIWARQKGHRTKRAQSKKGAEQKGREITMLRHRYIQGRNFFR